MSANHYRPAGGNHYSALDLNDHLLRSGRQVIVGMVVHEVLDGGGSARCKFEDNPDSITNPMPLLQRASKVGFSTWSPLTENEVVVVLCPAGDMMNGIIIGSFPCTDNPPPGFWGPKRWGIQAGGDFEIFYDLEAKSLRVNALVPGCTVDVNAQSVNVTATSVKIEASSVTLDADSVSVTGELVVDGNITGGAAVRDSAGTMSAIRQIYNMHTHTETDTVTLAPTPPMTGGA